MPFFPSRVAAAGILILLVGCAPTPVTWPDVDPTDAAGALVAPAQVFHGDCNRALGIDELGAALDTTLLLVDTSTAPDVVAILAGGTPCIWNSVDGVTVSALFLPSEVVSYEQGAACGEIPYYTLPGCFLEGDVNGIRLSGFVHRTGQTDTDALVEDAASVVALFTKNAVADEAAPVPTPVEGAWATPADCAAALAGIDFAAAFGVDAEFALGQSAPSGVPYSRAEVALWKGQDPPICGINKTSDDFRRFDFEVFGGARWMEDRVKTRPGAVEVKVDGLELVYKTDVGTEYSTLDVFNGVNYLRMSGLDMDATYPAVRAMVDYFNDLAGLRG